MRAGGDGARDGKLLLILSDRYLEKGQVAGPRLVGDWRRAPSSGQDRVCGVTPTLSSKPASRETRITSPV